MAGGNPTQGRNAEDFYPSPDECTIGLLDAEEQYIRAHSGFIFEPACGDGAMAKVFLERKFGVYCHDLVYRGYLHSLSGRDFLTDEPIEGTTGIPIITNPPFNLAPAFIRRALEDCAAPYLALLLKSTFWHAKSRYKLFCDHPPSVIYPMTWRPDFMKRGAPTMDCSWIVWDTNRPGTSYIPMLKPTI